MSSFGLGNVYLCLSMVSGAASQVLLKAMFQKTGPLVWTRAFLQGLLTAPVRLGQLGLAGSLMVTAFLFWAMSLSRLDMSYAYSLACCSALLVALCGVLFFGEAASARMWWGTAFIVLGSILIAPGK